MGVDVRSSNEKGTSYSFLICFLTRPISISWFLRDFCRVERVTTGSVTAEVKEAWAERSAGGTSTPNQRRGLFGGGIFSDVGCWP